MVGERTVGGDRPTRQASLPIVGDAAGDGGSRRITVQVGDVGAGHQPGDLGRDGRGRIAALLLPAFDPEGRTMRDHEVDRRPDVLLVQRGVGHAHLGGHQDRVTRLIELDAERVRRDLAVEQAVARHRTIGQLLVIEQEDDRVAGGCQVAIGEQRAPGLIEIAREDLAIGAEKQVVGVARRDRLAPRRGEAGDDRPREGLVFAGLDDVGAEVVLVDELPPLTGRRPRETRGRRGERGVVSVPAGIEGLF